MRARLIDINGKLVVEEELKDVDVYPDVIRWKHKTFILSLPYMHVNSETAYENIYNEVSSPVYWIMHG